MSVLFTETAELSVVVVSHGGSGGLYPAMAAGTPVLGISPMKKMCQCARECD